MGCSTLYFFVVDDFEGADDENVHEEHENEERSNSPAKVDCLRCTTHSEGGHCPKHIKTREKFSHLLL